MGMINMTETLLLAHLAATLFMIGIVWFVQVVHYPLFSKVGASGFADYERDHVRRTGRLLVMPMTLELALSIWAALSLGGSLAWTGLGLVSFIWITTWTVQVPAHRRLESGFDPIVCRKLARSNWWRSAAWTLRGGAAFALAWSHRLESAAIDNRTFAITFFS